MRTLPLAAAVLVVGSWAAATSTLSGQVPAADPLLVMGGRLWDGTGDSARPNPGILLENGTIRWMGATAGDRPAALPPGARTLELPEDAFVMPGLFDLHAHYAVDLFGEGRVDEYTVNPVLFLANGVTSTFPAGEVDPAEARRGRARIASGEIPGPRIYGSGPYWGTARPGWSHDAMTPDSIRKEATWWALDGARGFKAKGIRPEQLEVVIDVAHQFGITVTGHLDSGFRNSVNPRDAILMGIDRIEHFMGGDALPGTQSAYASLENLDLDDAETADRVRNQAKLFLEHGAYFDATLTAYGYYADREPAVFDDWGDEMGFLTPYARAVVESHLPRTPLEQFRKIYYVKRRTVKVFHDAGGADHLTLGTDHPSWGEFWSGFGAHRELHAIVLAGIPNAVALRAGTVNAARAMGVAERLGTVETGKYADLYIVRGDPLTRITDTKKGMYVIRAGRVYEPSELFASVQGRMGPAGETDADWWKGNTRLGR
ncbi:MAG TPA: amidohydrolase family protein [Longimicrobiales bacterium]|nr:amidohydrolase family protein [Longimicrobiales bacterium]